GKLQPKADIRIFIGYAPTKKAFRIYNRRTRRIVETIHVDFDELTALASEQSSPGPALQEMTPGTISSGLVQKSSSSASYVSTGSPSSTTVDQDAPSPSKSFTPTEIQSSVSLQDVGNDNLDIEVVHMGNDLLLGVPIPEDHPLNYIISPLSRPVSTRLQLHEQALFCYYDAFLTSVEPKTYKETLTQACWIEAVQEELHEFERLEACPTEKHVHAVKRIFRYLRGTVNRGLWYPKDSSIALTAFTDVDHAGCQDTRRSTSGSVQFLGERLISWSSKGKRELLFP
nr:uncharacterized mitochondrial protein AtMg00810-like [Tanacetum cinerariifolium]